ncbi:MAG: PadR family transcriptional regulator [Eubacteriaceae bacterium]
MLEHYIEGLLMGYDLSGYDIKQNIDNVKLLRSSYGSIYPTLKKMEKKDLIESTEIILTGRYKKIYSINESGRKDFIEWLKQPIKITHSEEEHLIKMFFYEYISKEEIQIIITKFLKTLKDQIHRQEVVKLRIEKDFDFYKTSTMVFTISYYKFLKGWYENFLGEL